MNIPDDLLYTETHEWIKREGDNIRVGITDHAQSELTDVVYVELPKMDRQANAKEAIAVVESVKAASDIYAPVKGTVVEVNKALEADPGLINREPYGQGTQVRTKNRSDRETVQNLEERIVRHEEWYDSGRIFGTYLTCGLCRLADSSLGASVSLLSDHGSSNHNGYSEN